MKNRLLLVVFVLGGVVLAGEIAMARLVAPWWGSGTVVWSVIIAIVLLAMALGYWIGGRRADKYPSSQALVLWLLPGILLLLLQPWIGKPLLGADPLLFLLFVVLASLAFFFLGAASPWALRLLDKDPEHSGALAGKLFASSTVGSFLGTLLSALVFLPQLGTGRTFFLLGALAIGAVALLQPRVLPLLFLPVALWISWGTAPSGKVLWQGESAEQHLQVEKMGDARVLKIDDGEDVQSVYYPGRDFTGALWDGPLYLWPLGGARSPDSLLVLGNGAGTTLSAWEKSYGGPAVGIELDPRITEVAKRYFGLRQDATVIHGDARWRMRGLRSSFSTIFLDTYDANFIPFHLLTEEFFLELKDILRPEGVVIINVHSSRDITSIIGRTSRAAFPYGKLWKYSPNNHFVALALEPLRAQRIKSALPLIPKALHPEALRAEKELRSLPRDGDLWTDDKAPAERYASS